MKGRQENLIDFLKISYSMLAKFKNEKYELLEYDITKYTYYCKCTMEPCGNG